MKVSNLNAYVSMAALGLAMASVPAFAQTSAAAPAAEEVDGLDTIVVTASGRDKTQLNSSVSVTSVDAKIINDFHPSSEAEVFRLLPGIQVAGTSGPGGNSNIAVRGLPVATGGSPFVQLQEDGLPTVLFGDIQFGNNDYWTHYDASVATVESVRGGKAATFASQAPGAVINYISQTGKQDGGFIELQKGINFDETRINFRNGGHINESMYYHIGGYFKTGRGPLHAGYNVSDSIQVKGNITKEFDGGKGFFRLFFKYADTQEPNYTGSPATATISNGKVSNIKPFAGFDGRDQSNYSIFNQNFLIVDRNGQQQRVKMDGITTKAKSIGGQFHYDFSDAITVNNNMRYTKMSGGFAAPFINVTPTASLLGKTLNQLNGNLSGPTTTVPITAIRYTNGPNAGQIYTGRYLNDNVNVRTNIRDIGSFANDLNVAGKFDAGFAKVTANAGLFYMNQKIAMDWHVDAARNELSGNNPSQLDLFGGSGVGAANQLTAFGILGYGNNWGSCCARDYELSYTDTAPYLSLDLDADRFAIDGSVRFDSVKASGSARASSGTTTFTNTSLGNGNSINIPTFTADGPLEVLNYTRNYTSWSIGALFKATDGLSVFARASKGGRFNADRQTLGGKFRRDGQLCTGADAKAGTSGCTADGVTPSVDFVKQYEIGLKNRGRLLGGSYTAELTLLKGNFKQSTFELSATKCPGGAGGCVIDAKYKTSGAEFYGTYRNHGFSLFANGTFTKAKQLDSGATAFRRADNIPNLTYTVAANYDVGEYAAVGMNVTGVTSQVNGGLEYPGGATFGGNIKVRPIENLELGIQAYNLFNKFDIRGAGNVSDAGASPAVISGAPVIGRTFTASVKYKF